MYDPTLIIYHMYEHWGSCGMDRNILNKGSLYLWLLWLVLAFPVSRYPVIEQTLHLFDFKFLPMCMVIVACRTFFLFYERLQLAKDGQKILS